MNETQSKETIEKKSQLQPPVHVPGGPVAGANPEAAARPWAALRSLRAETEIHAISRALEESGWNRKRAAKLLSISYRGLLYKIRQYDITPASRSNLSPVSRPEVS
jgi:two-component system, NtrC family, response regulator AtoC